MDDLSLISSVKMDIDNGDAMPVFPTDGLLDERREQFQVRTQELAAGEHVATIVATDRVGNTNVTKVLFTIR